MYLRGSKWSMNRRRKRPNWFRLILISILIIAGAYVDRFVVAVTPSPFVPTPTATRAPESFITEAEDLFKQGKLLQSIETYQQAILARPSEPTYYLALARVQIYAGKYKDAQASAENALLLSPNNSMAHAMRAWALDFQGDYLGAEAAIKEALQQDPNNGIAHAIYVEILIDSYLAGTAGFDNLNTAIEESRVALALAPDTIEAHRARGYILEATENYEQAIAEFQTAISYNENIPDLHLALGRNYRRLGVYDKAVEEFTRANALNPADPTPDLFISRTYATIGEYPKAMQYAETAVKDNPADPNLRGNLGVMYYRNLLWPEAVRELGLVINGGQSEDGYTFKPMNLVPNDVRLAEYYFTYGLALARLNRCGEALKIAQTITDRIPSDEIAMDNAGKIVEICRQNLQVTPTPTLAVPAITPTGTP
jgi:tetratricopeptide (TPR) repeat protein